MIIKDEKIKKILFCIIIALTSLGFSLYFSNRFGNFAINFVGGIAIFVASLFLFIPAKKKDKRWNILTIIFQNIATGLLISSYYEYKEIILSGFSIFYVSLIAYAITFIDFILYKYMNGKILPTITSIVLIIVGAILSFYFHLFDNLMAFYFIPIFLFCLTYLLSFKFNPYLSMALSSVSCCSVVLIIVLVVIGQGDFDPFELLDLVPTKQKKPKAPKFN